MTFDGRQGGCQLREPILRLHVHGRTHWHRSIPYTSASRQLGHGGEGGGGLVETRTRKEEEAGGGGGEGGGGGRRLQWERSKSKEEREKREEAVQRKGFVGSSGGAPRLGRAVLGVRLSLPSSSFSSLLLLTSSSSSSSSSSLPPWARQRSGLRLEALTAPACAGPRPTALAGSPPRPLTWPASRRCCAGVHPPIEALSTTPTAPAKPLTPSIASDLREVGLLLAKLTLERLDLVADADLAKDRGPHVGVDLVETRLVTNEAIEPAATVAHATSDARKLLADLARRPDCFSHA
eukprot:9476714-Pyramimonas_sp.AAC.1